MRDCAIGTSPRIKLLEMSSINNHNFQGFTSVLAQWYLQQWQTPSYKGSQHSFPNFSIGSYLSLWLWSPCVSDSSHFASLQCACNKFLYPSMRWFLSVEAVVKQERQKMYFRKSKLHFSAVGEWEKQSELNKGCWSLSYISILLPRHKRDVELMWFLGYVSSFIKEAKTLHTTKAPKCSVGEGTYIGDSFGVLQPHSDRSFWVALRLQALGSPVDR